MQKIVLVGAGDYYKGIVGSSLNLLKEKGRAEIDLVVDIKSIAEIKKISFFSGINYRQRMSQQKLSDLLLDYRDAIILLGHVNELHTPDAVDLLKNGFKIMVEKPYSINKEQFELFKSFVDKYDEQIVLLEYYLMMKSAPLLILAGLIEKNSFFLKEKGVLEYDSDIKKIFGNLLDFIGYIINIKVEVLEGEEETGVVDHRGLHLIEKTKGGGMLMDLGTHAVSPLFAIKNYIGKISLINEVRVAYCNEYIEMTKKKYDLSDEEIGESYAEIDCQTEENIPVKISVGKYVLANKNRRRIIINGSKGKLIMDLSDCSLSFFDKNGNSTILLTIPKRKETKYYPVIHAALDVLNNKNPFLFNTNEVALESQEFIFQIVDMANQYKKFVKYSQGSEPEQIFNL